MKKAFDQTVRDLKRGVNKKVLKVSGVEQKILDATSNEPWGPHGSHLAEIAQATRNLHEYHMIMTVIWKRINDTGKNWRHVYKALTVLEYLVAHGSERVIDEIREHTYQISTLSSFQYIDSSGRDQGSNVRRKTQSLVSLVNDKERIREVRQKALANQDKHQSSYSSSRTAYRSPGSSDDQYDDDHYKGNYGRDEERYGDRSERDLGYRDDDRYRDHDHRGSSDSADYQTGSRNMSTDGGSSSHDDDHYTSSASGRTDDLLQDERQLEHSEERLGAPPSYEEATRDLQDPALEGRNGDQIADTTVKELSPNRSSSLESQFEVPGTPLAAESAPVQNFEQNFFDAFDPREPISVAPSATDHFNTSAANSLEMDIFGSVTSLNLTHSCYPLPAASTNANVEADVPASAAFGSGFGTYSLDPMSTSNMFNQPSGNPFGDPPFEAIQETIPTQQESFASLPSFESSIPTGIAEHYPSEPSNMESITSYGLVDSFGGSNYPPFEVIQEIFPDKQESFAPLPSFTSFIPTVSSGDLPPVPSNVESKSFGLLDSFGGSNYIADSTGGPGTLQFATSNMEANTTLGFGDSFFGAKYTPLSTIQQNLVTNQSNLAPDVPAKHLSADISSLLAPQGGNETSNVLARQDGPATFLHSQTVQPTTPAHMQANFLQSAQLTPFTSQAGQAPLQLAPPNTSTTQRTQLNLLSQQLPPAPITTEGTILQTLSSPKQPSMDKFETKSTVWADTLKRGLVNLNISGPKTNPHAEIGVDFDFFNRKEKRTEEKKGSAAPLASNITMGKAMGSGSGIGRADASGLSPHLNPMVGPSLGMGTNATASNPMMGMGMGTRASIVGYGMGMGMNMGMRTDMGMNMGMNQYQGMPMRPLMGMPPGGASMMPGMPPGMMPGMTPGDMMPGAGYHGMTGTGSYNFQQPYGGARG